MIVIFKGIKTKADTIEVFSKDGYYVISDYSGNLIIKGFIKKIDKEIIELNKEVIVIFNNSTNEAIILQNI